MHWAISVQAGVNPGTISLFQWKAVPWSVAGATRTPHQGPWPAGSRPPYDRLFLGRDCARPAACFCGYMSVCLGVIVRTWINQRCICVSSGVLVRSAPCDPGVCVLSPLCRSACCAGFSDGAVPRRLCGRKPLQERPRDAICNTPGLTSYCHVDFHPPHPAWSCAFFAAYFETTWQMKYYTVATLEM